MKKEMTFEEMNREADRLDIIDTCWNMVSAYAFMHSNNVDRSLFFDKMWSKSDDIVHVMPWGIEVTREANEYNRHPTDTIYDADSDVTDTNMVHNGMLMFHSITTPVIEVAEDLQSCRLAFRSPGHETCVWPGSAKEMEYSAEWAWSGYGWDFILEDGEWRVKNMRVTPVFKCDPRVSWAEAPALAPDVIETIVQHLPPDTIPAPRLFQYAADVIVPCDEPEPPAPYHDLETCKGRTEIGIGYGAVHGFASVTEQQGEKKEG